MFEIDVLDLRILFMKVVILGWGISCRVDQIGRVAVM